MRPVRAYGLVLWLKPSEYARLVALDPERRYPDATEEQIAQQDAWREELLDREQRDLDELARLFQA